MSRFSASNNKDLYFLTNNNKDIQKMVIKQLPLYYGVTKTPNVNNPCIFGLLIVDIYSCESKYKTRNKDSPIMTANAAIKKQNNSNPLISVVLMERVHSCKSKHRNTKNDNNK